MRRINQLAQYYRSTCDLLSFTLNAVSSSGLVRRRPVIQPGHASHEENAFGKLSHVIL
jgi:hypothetical protein